MDKVIFQPFKYQPEEGFKICPECDGAGEAEYEVAVSAPMAWRGGWLEDQLMECQMCHGDGEVEDENWGSE